MGIPGSASDKRLCLPMQEMQLHSLGWEDPLKKEMATSSSILTWEMPWTEELVNYSPSSRKDLDTVEHTHTFCIIFTFLSLSLPDVYLRFFLFATPSQMKSTVLEASILYTRPLLAPLHLCLVCVCQVCRSSLSLGLNLVMRWLNQRTSKISS